MREGSPRGVNSIPGRFSLHEPMRRFLGRMCMKINKKVKAFILTLIVALGLAFIVHLITNSTTATASPADPVVRVTEESAPHGKHVDKKGQHSEAALYYDSIHYSTHANHAGNLQFRCTPGGVISQASPHYDTRDTCFGAPASFKAGGLANTVKCYDNASGNWLTVTNNSVWAPWNNAWQFNCRTF